MRSIVDDPDGTGDTKLILVTRDAPTIDDLPPEFRAAITAHAARPKSTASHDRAFITALRELALVSNRIRQLPAEIGQLQSLARAAGVWLRLALAVP